MAIGKKKPTPKTRYQKEQQQLGRAAYPLIEPQRQRIADLTNNADQYRQEGINNYFNSGAEWNDAMTNYRRQMANAAANNYNATHGGYSSAGQRVYDDYQKGLNDYNARLYNKGVNTIENMLSNDRNAAQSYYQDLIGQHDYAKQPDAIDVSNQLIEDSNKNWWTNALQQGGTVASMFGPVGRVIGGAMQLGGWAGSTDYNDAINNVMRSGGLIPSTSSVNYSNPASNTVNTFKNLGSLFQQGQEANDGNFWRNVAQGRYVTNPDGTITDKKTGMTLRGKTP